jgi:hypothetical protein
MEKLHCLPFIVCREVLVVLTGCPRLPLEGKTPRHCLDMDHSANDPAKANFKIPARFFSSSEQATLTLSFFRRIPSQSNNKKSNLEFLDHMSNLAMRILCCRVGFSSASISE